MAPLSMEDYCYNLTVQPHSNIHIQYIPRNMHTVFALLCFVVVIHWLIFPYPSGLLHWHCGNLTIAPVPAKQPWWIWINTSCEFIMNDCITTTKQSTTKPCAYFLGYTVVSSVLYKCVMKTSLNGNISALLALCEENPPVTGGFPSLRAHNSELWCFIWSAPDQTVEETSEALLIWDTIALIMTLLWCGCKICHHTSQRILLPSSL